MKELETFYNWLLVDALAEELNNRGLNPKAAEYVVFGMYEDFMDEWSEQRFLNWCNEGERLYGMTTEYMELNNRLVESLRKSIVAGEV